MLTTTVIFSFLISRSSALWTHWNHSSPAIQIPIESASEIPKFKDEEWMTNKDYHYYIELSPEFFFDGTKADNSWALAILNVRRRIGYFLNQGFQQIGSKKETSLVDRNMPESCFVQSHQGYERPNSNPCSHPPHFYTLPLLFHCTKSSLYL